MQHCEEDCWVQPDGSRIWMQWEVRPWYTETDEVGGIIVFTQNVTTHKQAEAALQQSENRFRSIFNSAFQFIALISPTGELLSANETALAFAGLRMEDIETERFWEITCFKHLPTSQAHIQQGVLIASSSNLHLSIINRSGGHLLNLINDILEMSKIEAGRITFTPNYFDLYSLLNILEEMFRLRAAEKGLQFIINLAPDLPRYIETDENKIRQILINLVGNAIKFTQYGQIILRISTFTPDKVINYPSVAQPDKVEGSYYRGKVSLNVAVEDIGIGIASNELDSLFEPFIQSNNRQSAHEGTGLGLPISRQFVQLMGGDLTVCSTPGVSSVFAFTIPVQLVESVTLATSSLPRRILGLAPNQPTYHILVVEDNETNRQLLVQLLQSVGFKVQAATNGQAAIALWETWQPQLIWMDMRMPVMNGYEATGQIRAQEQAKRPHTERTKIIALTAGAFEEEQNKVLEAGCDDFVRKPFQETELLEKMTTHLGVQYLYAEPEVATSVPSSSSFDAIAALHELSPPLLTQLHQATVELDNQHLVCLIEQLATTQPQLATLLPEKVNTFDFVPILQLLQAAMPPETRIR